MTQHMSWRVNSTSLQIIYGIVVAILRFGNLCINNIRGRAESKVVLGCITAPSAQFMMYILIGSHWSVSLSAFGLTTSFISRIPPSSFPSHFVQVLSASQCPPGPGGIARRKKPTFILSKRQKSICERRHRHRWTQIPPPLDSNSSALSA